MKTFRDYINLVTQLSEAPDTVVPGGGSITNVDPNSAEGKAMIARSQAVQNGQSPDSAAPAPGQAATPAPAAAAPAAPKPAAQWNKGVLGKGSKGPEVSALQKKLGIADTGTYDAATIAAVQALQKKLGVAADGAYGPGTKAAHDKMPPAQAATPAPANVASPGQPPATAAQPELGTKKGATQAIPTGPVNANNPSGVGAKADISADQAQAALDNGSEYDIKRLGGRERLQQLAGVKTPAPATPTTTPAAPAQQTATPAPAPAAPAADPAAYDNFVTANPGTTVTPAQFAAKSKNAPAAAPKPAGTTSTQSNQSVSGTMKMGKPDGPITFNGKQVAPGAPEYAAASAALIAAQGRGRPAAQTATPAPTAVQNNGLGPNAPSAAEQGLPDRPSAPGYWTTQNAPAAAPQQAATPAAPPGETAGGAATGRPARAPTGARAQRLQQQQDGTNARTFESRDTQFQKELNAMLRIANLPDRGL